MQDAAPLCGGKQGLDTTENLYIEGHNLEVLKLLQESYLGKVKMIYIDPPYNTGNDFIYADDFMRSQEEENEQMGMFDEEKNRLFKNTDTNGRFHSDWYSMIYSRLMLARYLLTDDGVIFISIDEKESGNLRKICDEVFGASNFISNIVWQSRASISNDYEISLNHNHTLIYAKRREASVFGGDPIDVEDYVNVVTPSQLRNAAHASPSTAIRRSHSKIPAKQHCKKAPHGKHLLYRRAFLGRLPFSCLIMA